MANTGGSARDRVLANGPLVRLIGAHLLAVVAEWASIVAVLVYAFEQGGSRVTGLASLAILAPTVVGAPVAASLTNTFRPQVVRRFGLAVQVAGYGVAAVAAAAEAPVWVVVVAAVLALGALTTLRPTGAVLLPAVVRSTPELTTANLWVSYSECTAALLGPLLAAGLLALGGPSAALVGCAAVLAIALALSLAGVPSGPPPGGGVGVWRPGPVLSGAIDTMRTRPWTVGVLGVLLARSALVGAFNVLLVVLAFDQLDIGGGGAGLLNALAGFGALASTAVATLVVRRSRLAPSLAIGLGALASLCALLGAMTELPVAMVVLPLLGLGGALLNSLARMLLQRSADPRVLGSLFALIELVGGVGLLLGAGLVQVLIAVGDARLALFGLAVLLGAVLLLTGRAVWRADSGADVPVVEMSLLQDLPVFAPLSPLELEAVARSVEHHRFVDGEVVIRQGDLGDHFYAVVNGGFDIVMDGEHVRRAERGDCFGEIALLADVPRTASVIARGPGVLLAVPRVPFLVAVTGSDTSRAAAWGQVQAMPVQVEVPSDLSVD